MSVPSPSATLDFPFATPPQPSEAREVRPGVIWLRFALPFRLDHINIYLLRDGDGWAAFDTGIDDAPTRAAWAAVLPKYPLTRLIVSHFHPDHVGLAGWLSKTYDLPLSMSRTEYLFSLNLTHNLEAAGPQRGYYRERGVDDQTVENLVGGGHRYLKMTSGVPSAYDRLVAGDTLRLDSRFDIMTGGGHAPEQVMLLNAEQGFFLAADQVLARISPNIAVWAHEPFANPLGEYLSSLATLAQQIPEGLLVLPGHNLPFFGLHARIAELEAHHAARCAELLAACTTARTTAELVPVLFPRPLDSHQLGFAFGETQAHVNYLVSRGELRLERRNEIWAVCRG